MESIIPYGEYLDGHIKVFILPQYALPDQNKMNVLWNLHPKEKSKVFVHGKWHDTPRYLQTYMKDYPFSGSTCKVIENLPSEMEVYKYYANELTNYLGSFPINGFLVNWYQNGSSYIGHHADKTKIKGKQILVPGVPILTISLGQSRTFRIRDIKTQKKIIDISLHHGMVCVMSYEMQSLYHHEITKQSPNVIPGGRISITMRRFMD